MIEAVNGKRVVVISNNRISIAPGDGRLKNETRRAEREVGKGDSGHDE